MDHLKHYTPIMNQIYLRSDTSKIPDRIQSVLSKSNSNMLHLDMLISSTILNHQLQLNKSKALLIRSKPKNSMRTRKCRQLKLTQTKMLNQSVGDKPKATSSFIFYNQRTRNNKTKWTHCNTPINKTNPIHNNSSINNNNTNSFNLSLNQASSFLKTSLNSTTILCHNNSTTISKVTQPNLYLYNQTKKKLRPTLDHSLINQTIQTKKLLNITSPQVFSPYDTENNNNDTNTPSTMIDSYTKAKAKAKAKANRIDFDNKEYSLSSFRKKCNKIEMDCNEVGKAVKNMPMKLVFDKSKYKTLLNMDSDNEDKDKEKKSVDNEIIEDMPSGDIKKIFTINDLMNVSIKSQRILLESNCIAKVNPLLAVKATESIKKIFSIKPKVEDNRDYDKIKKNFSVKTNQMKCLLRKNLEANRKCNEIFEKFKL